MKQTYTFFFYVALLLCYSCDSSTRKETKEIQMTSKGKISLLIDETTPDFSMGLQYVEAEKELIFNINWATNSLQMYDLEDGNLIKSIPFEKEGDQGVGELMAFHVHTLDSIFLFPFRGSYFSLTDTSGNVKYKFRYDAPENHTAAFVHNISFITPPFISGNEAIFKTRPTIVSNYFEMTDDMLAGSSLGFRLNLETMETELLPHYYPKGYLEAGFKRFESSRAQSEDKLVYSFFGDHHLYWSEGLNAPLQVVEGKSKFLSEKLPLLPVDRTPIQSQKYSFASSRYDNLLYDPYREVFYRFAYPDLDVETEEEVRALRNNPGEFVIMVFDKDLQLLGENIFGGSKYLPLNAFVGKNGLYMSLNNPDNSNNEEDRMAFEYLTF